MFISTANASENVAAPMSAGSSIMSLLPMVLIFVIFYFFLIRPQVKKQKLVENMIGGLKKGDKVIAAGGLQGTINNIDGDVIHLSIAESVVIKVQKSSVTELLNKQIIKEETTKAVEEKKNTLKPVSKTASKSKKVKK